MKEGSTFFTTVQTKSKFVTWLTNMLICLPDTSSHADSPSCNEKIGIKLSVPLSRSLARRLKLATTPTLTYVGEVHSCGQSG